MKRATVADMKARFSDFLRECEKGPVVVTRNGKAVGLLVAVNNDDEVDDMLIAHSPRLREILDAGHREIAEGKGIPFDEFWARMEVKQAKSKSNGKPRAKKRAKGK